MQRWIVALCMLITVAIAAAACGYSDDGASDPLPATPPPVADETLLANGSSVRLTTAEPSAAWPDPTDQGINVQGFGQAAAPADVATLQLLYGLVYCYECPQPAEPQGVTLDDLQPVIDALLAIGIAREDIDASIVPGGPYPVYEKYAPTPTDPTQPWPAGGDLGQIIVRIGTPSSERLSQVVTTATDAATATGRITPYNTGVIYTVNSCDALLQQALNAAVDDARHHAALVGAAIGRSPGTIVWISESPGYDPYGPSPCAPRTDVYPTTWYPPYDPSLPAEVRISTGVNITFAVE